jgi:hypothetical protein
MVRVRTEVTPHLRHTRPQSQGLRLPNMAELDEARRTASEVDYVRLGIEIIGVVISPCTRNEEPRWQPGCVERYGGEL